MRDRELYDQVAREVSNNAVDPGIWAKAYADAQGNEEKARARYIKLRVRELAEERYKEQKKAQQLDRIVSQPNTSGARKKIIEGIGAIGLLIIGILLIAGGFDYGEKRGYTFGAFALIFMGIVFVIATVNTLRKE